MSQPTIPPTHQGPITSESSIQSHTLPTVTCSTFFSNSTATNNACSSWDQFQIQVYEHPQAPPDQHPAGVQSGPVTATCCLPHGRLRYFRHFLRLLILQSLFSSSNKYIDCFRKK